MADKDKKPGLGEWLVFLVIAAALTWALYKIKNAVWKWATANRKRAWVCVPILLWPFVFATVEIVVILLLGIFGWPDDPPTPEQQFAMRAVTWANMVVAYVISLLITRRVVRKIPEEVIDLEPPVTGTTSQKKQSSNKKSAKWFLFAGVFILLAGFVRLVTGISNGDPVMSFVVHTVIGIYLIAAGVYFKRGNS